MSWQWAVVSDAGARPVQQDRWGHAESDGVHCWVLCDGLGGHGGGELAAHLAVETVLAAFQTSPRQPADSYLEAANQAILAAQLEHEMQRQMRSTGLVLLIEGERAAWAHVGDTRLYAFSPEGVHRTKDHSVPQAMVDSGDLREDQIRFHEDRNRLVRSLGSAGPCRAVLTEGSADAFLLATDGFWEWVNDEAMAATAEPAAWLAPLVAAMAGADDNYTAIAVRRAP